MPAAHQQRDGGSFEFAALKNVNANVPDQVIDRIDGLAGCHRERFGCPNADHERPSEAGSVGHGNCVELIQGDASLIQGLVQCWAQGLEVRSSGDLWHDTAEASVLIHAARNHVGQQAVAAHDADAGLVAGGLDAEHERLKVFGSQRLEVGAHHERIDAIGHVVALAKVDLLEAQRPIEANRARVVGANLEKHIVRALGGGFAH